MASVRQILDSHERELLQRLDQLRAQVREVEAELGEVRGAKAGLSKQSSSAADLAFVNKENPYARMTNKQLALTALKEHFPEGALASELIDFFKTEWDRVIDRATFSPQLSRLLQDGDLEKEGKVWKLKKNKPSVFD